MPAKRLTPLLCATALPTISPHRAISALVYKWQNALLPKTDRSEATRSEFLHEIGPRRSRSRETSTRSANRQGWQRQYDPASNRRLSIRRSFGLVKTRLRECE